MSKYKKGFIYARVSSEMQAEKGLSIPSQLELTRNFAREHEIQVIREFVDEAESATTDQRPQFQEMIAECKKEDCDIDCIIVWKLSRFARNRFDSIAYKKLLNRKGIKVVSVSEPIDDSPEGMVLEGVIEIFDDWYLRLLSREVLRGMKEAAKQGFHTGGRPPYGYQLKKVIENNTERTLWEINPSEAETVRLIYSLFSKGLGYARIIQELEKLRIKPRKSDQWSKVSIHDILRKSYYSGNRIYNVRKAKDLGSRTLGKKFIKDESEWIQMSVPRIIDDPTAIAVRERIEKRKHTKIDRHPTYLLTGLLKCGICNGSYCYGGIGRNGKYFYYRCAAKVNKGKDACNNRTIRGDQLDAEIIEKVRKVIFSEDSVRKFYSFVERVKSEEKSELEVRLEQNQKGLKEIEKKLNNYRKAIELGADISLVIEPMNALKSEKQLLEETTRDLVARLENQPKPEAFRFTKEAHDNFMEMIRTFSTGASVDNLRLFLQRFIQKIVVYPDNISIVYIPLLMNTLKDSGPEDLYTVSMVPEVGVEPTRGLSPAGF
jgi:site-specific DNA recombinase